MTTDDGQGTDGAVACPADALLDLFEWPVIDTLPPLPDAREAMGNGQIDCQREYAIGGTLLARLWSDSLVLDQLRREAGLPKAPGWRYRLIEVVRHVRRINWQERQFKQLWFEEWIRARWPAPGHLQPHSLGVCCGRAVACDRCGRPAGLSLRRTKAAVCFRCVSAEDL